MNWEKSEPCYTVCPRARLEGGAVFLDLHHQVVDVDKLWPDRQRSEGSLGQDLLEPVVVLDQLGQGTLQTNKHSNYNVELPAQDEAKNKEFF